MPKISLFWTLVAAGGAVIALSWVIAFFLAGGSAPVEYAQKSGDAGEQVTPPAAPETGPTQTTDAGEPVILPVIPPSPIRPDKTPARTIVSGWIPAGSSRGDPVRLTIPRIGVAAAVVRVGVAPDGTMEIPKGPAEVAWFEPGPRPGESGSAVIAGHFGWKDNIPAVFDNLSEVGAGDRMYVEDGTGAVTAFIVRETRRFSPDADASEVFTSSDGGAHLNLITCGGVWDEAQKSYSDRLVVFADKE